MRNLKDVSIEDLLHEIERRKADKLAAEAKPVLGLDSPIGEWHVTTEGDEEGRSTKDLGTHYGHVVDIALRLAGHAFYSLRFAPPAPAKHIENRPSHVAHIALGIDTGTWDYDGHTRAKALNAFLHKQLADAPFAVEESNYYASVLVKKLE